MVQGVPYVHWKIKDAVDLAGNDVAASASTENLLKFKKSVKQFIEFVVTVHHFHVLAQFIQYFTCFAAI